MRALCFVVALVLALYPLLAPHFGDPLAWLLRKNPGKARALAAAGALCAVATLALAGTWLARVPWSLDRASPTAQSRGGMCDAAGAVYVIRVRESTYWCGGGDAKCPTGDVMVAYDPRNPSHCRVRSNVDRPSLYELWALLFGVTWLCFAGVVASWRGAEWLPAGASQGRSYRAFYLALGVTLGAMVLSSMLYRS
jgi:hypothetical protein